MKNIDPSPIELGKDNFHLSKDHYYICFDKNNKMAWAINNLGYIGQYNKYRFTE